MSDDVEVVMRRVGASRRYRDVDPALVRRFAAEELPRTGSRDEAVKRVKRRLHQAVGAFTRGGASIERDVQHALQWHAIRSLRAEGADAYEVGWIGRATTDKGKGVEMFKAGWSRDRRTVRVAEVAL